jgi:hypothetical protein
VLFQHEAHQPHQEAHRTDNACTNKAEPITPVCATRSGGSITGSAGSANPLCYGNGEVGRVAPGQQRQAILRTHEFSHSRATAAHGLVRVLDRRAPRNIKVE